MENHQMFNDEINLKESA